MADEIKLLTSEELNVSLRNGAWEIIKPEQWIATVRDRERQIGLLFVEKEVFRAERDDWESTSKQDYAALTKVEAERDELQRQLEAATRTRDGSHELCWSNDAKQAHEIARLQRQRDDAKDQLDVREQQVLHLQEQLSELRAAINPDGTLTEHSQFVDTARDGANAIETTADYEERREDTKRLDWLEQETISGNNQHLSWHLVGDTLRQAIDFARKAEVVRSVAEQDEMEQ